MRAKVCLVGEAESGNTQLVRKAIDDPFNDRYLTTLGTKVSRKEVMVSRAEGIVRLDLTIWDITGRRGVRDPLRDACFQGARGVVAVCNLRRKSTVIALDGWVGRAQNAAGRVPIVFVGTSPGRSFEEESARETLRRLAAAHGGRYFITSPLGGDSVDDALHSLAEEMVQTSPSSA